jgi:protein TonB
MWSLPASLHLPGVAPLQPRKSPASNLDNGPAIAGHASMLGVGHFTVPPDVIDERDVAASWSTIRTIVVPHGITAVPRRSPITARKRTPWHSVPDVYGVVERAGGREWFTGRLFVEPKQTHLRGACTTSGMVHAVVVILVLLLLAARAARTEPTPRPRMNVQLRMPVTMVLMPATIALPPARTSIERSSPATNPSRPAPPPARAIEAPAAAPLETPSRVEAEPAKLDAAPSDGEAVSAGVEGATNGVAGGVVDGTGSGSPVATPMAPPEAPGPFRVGGQLARPRKIKDVRPVYPASAMSLQVSGSVLIEATIGADGKVHNAIVIRSIGPLDQAALDAVRQWEYEPSRLNGKPVAVTMVIVVTFALLEEGGSRGSKGNVLPVFQG